MVVAGAIAAALVFVGAVWWFQKTCHLVQYLFFTRYALASGAVLLVFPIVSVSSKGMKEFTGNLFDLGPVQLGLVSFLAILVSWAAALSLGVLYLAIPKRCGQTFVKARPHEPNRLPAIPEWAGALLASLPALPTIAVAYFRSTADARLAGVAGAAGAAAVFYAAWAKVGRPTAHKLARKFRKAPAPAADHVERLHPLNVGVFLAVALGTYLGFGIAAFPAWRTAENCPALAFVLLLLMLGCLGLNLLAFLLDFYRVPVLALAAIVSLFSVTIFGSDHHYEIKPWTSPVAGPLGPAEAMKAWLKTHPAGRHPTVVFVAASGGGIKAATWTATVLAGLREEDVLGERFASSIVLVSSVSGGSVGSMYFLEGYEECGPPSVDRARGAIEHAGTSSLAAVGWGLAYPDFLRIGLSIFVPGDWDRGWALEERWRLFLREPGATLSDWRTGIAEGWRPVPIFNATIVETGDRLTMSPVDVPQDELKQIHQALTSHNPGLLPPRRDFRNLYPGKDLRVLTAARLSAAFPWVSPVARPGDVSIRESERWHVGDGGYFDNEGVVSALEFMEKSLGQLFEDPPKPPRRKAVLLRIRASPDPDPPESEGEWISSLAGPLLTMLAVRTASQTARNDVDVDRFCESWRCMGLEVEEVNLVLDAKTAMSWHLTKPELDGIHGAWRAILEDSKPAAQKTENGRELHKLRNLFP